MAIDYANLLTADQKRSILEQRIAQFASEAYQHELNKQVAETIGDEASVNNANAALATIEVAVTTHQAELASLPAVEG
jgi:hypothetical protein